MNFIADRGGRIAIAFARDDFLQARKIAHELNGYKPPAEIAEMPTKIGFAAASLEAKTVPLPSSAQEIDLSITVRHALRDADHLIVLCSAAAAEDRFIDEQIRTFLSHRVIEGVTGRLHPVILAGNAAAAMPPAAVEAGETPIANLSADEDGMTKGLLLMRAAALGVTPARLELLEKGRERKRAMAALWAIGGVALAAGVAAVCLPMVG